MATIRKLTYTKKLPDGTIVRRKTLKYYVCYTDERGVKRRVPAFQDRASSLQRAADIQRQVEQMRAGIFDPKDIQIYTIGKLLQDYELSLQTKGKSKKHIAATVSRVSRIVRECSWMFPGDMSASAAQKALQRLLNTPKKDGGISSITHNHYCTALKMFESYLLTRKVINTSFFDSLEKVHTHSRLKHERRAVSMFTVLRLILTTRKSKKVHYGLDGETRAMMYMIAASTGLRCSEITSLTMQSFVLDDPPHVCVAGTDTKNRMDAKIPLLDVCAQNLREWFKKLKKPSNALLFPGVWPKQVGAGRILKKDLKESGIPYIVDGKFFDFHSLRTFFGTQLERFGVPLSVTQTLMRHQDPKTTKKYYSKMNLEDLASFIRKKPT